MEDDEVVETEIILDKRRADGSLDFIVYGHDGELSNRSLFPPGKKTQPDPELARSMTIVEAAPFSCMGCHATATNDDGVILRTVEFTTLVGAIGTCSDDV